MIEDNCPKCNSPLIVGFGLAGGGYGRYEACSSCDYFFKEQSEDCMPKIKEKASDEEFLKYFYEEARHSMGPADADIYHYIKESFVRTTGKDLPDNYKLSKD